MKYFFDAVRDQASNRKYLLEPMKKRSNVHQKIQFLTNEKYFAKSISLVMAFLQNCQSNCRLQLFAEFNELKRGILSSLIK